MNVLVIPFGSAGDVHPLVGIATGLRDRGHNVTVAVCPVFEPLVRRVGLAYIPVGTAEDFERSLHNPDLWHPTRAFAVVARDGIIPALRPLYDLITEHVRDGNTTVVVGSLALSARIAREKFSFPLVTVHLQPSIIRSLYEMPALPGATIPSWVPRFVKRIFWWLGDTMVIDKALDKDVNGFRAELGLPRVRSFFGNWWHSPDRVLGLFPDWFGQPQPDWPEQLRLTGFPLWDERGVTALPEGLEEFLSAGEPPIVFTAGSAMRHGSSFFAESVAACQLLGRRGLLLTRYPDQVPASLPEGVRHFSYAPFSQVLPRAAALVHHGGIGTMAQALAAGIPQLVMPLAHDQPDNAARARRLGVGRSLLPKYYRGPAVARELKLLLESEDVNAACKQAASRLHGKNAIDDAARVIEEAAALHATGVRVS